MTISEPRLHISIATLGLIVASALCADRVLAQSSLSCLTATACVPVTLTANLQLTNLHPAVTHVQVHCAGSIQNGTLYGTSNQAAVVSRGYTGGVTASLNVPKYIVAGTATHAITMSCKLQLVKGGGTSGQAVADAVASATGPQGVLDSNWGVLATGATVAWTQSVTFPNVSPAP
jgi:hypothetical protein